MLACPLLLAIPAHAEKKGFQEKEGDILQLVIPATAYATTFFMDDADGRGQFYKSFLTNIAVTEALKYGLDKERPNDNGSRSFPSGHTSMSFQGASFIQKRYGFKYSIPAYIAATYVGWTRVDAQKHFKGDVVAGAAIGITSTYLFTTPLMKDFTVTPLVGNGVYGITINGEF